MARKNIFDIDPKSVDVSISTEDPIIDSRPLAHLPRSTKRSSPIGAFSNSLNNVSEKALRVEELEEKLKKGQAVVELDPALIDNSFIADRLGVSVKDEENFVEQIRDNGQKVPILVRPNPNIADRYQVAYGHRRLAAVKKIGINVKAVVRELSDEELVVSQGQENNARTNLSFIERSYFSYRLENNGFNRDVIMSALGVDKAALSRMIAIIEKLPKELIESIGSAPDFGRIRWAELGELVQIEKKRKNALKKIKEPGFAQLTSNERFQTIYRFVRQLNNKDERISIWQTPSGVKVVKITENNKKMSLSFDKKSDMGFGAYVEEKLDKLYENYLLTITNEDE